jgi:hypothetical protein
MDCSGYARNSMSDDRKFIRLAVWIYVMAEAIALIPFIVITIMRRNA